MEQQEKDDIADRLRKSGVDQPCPRCSHKTFTVIGSSIISLQEKPGVLVIGGDVVPVAVLACTRCGFVTQHALGSLGLMPKAGEETK